jgi:thiol-disulfide isomerase/thioredoxin
MQMRNTYIAAAIVIALMIGTFVFSRYFFVVPPKVLDDKTFNNEFGLMLKDYSGKDVPLYQFRRQIVIAYAWASWCTYCGEEMQHLAELKKTYGDKIQILAINRAEPLSDAKAFTDKLNTGDAITLLLDPSDAFFKSIAGYAMPETVFIDASGNIVYHQRGPIDMPSLEARIKELVR